MDEEILQKMSENDEAFETIITTTIQNYGIPEYEGRPTTTDIGVSFSVYNLKSSFCEKTLVINLYLF